MASPDTNAGAIRLLGRHHLIKQDVAESVARSVGFRNVLVHQYTEVDDTIVIAALDRLDDLRSFVSQISAWILAQSSADGRS